MTIAIKSSLSAYAAGILFGVGLIVGGMTQPSKVIGFLDIAGNWDPSLAFVMGGAVLALLPLLRRITKRAGPLWGGSFGIPTRRDIDGRLIVGAGMFGIGWGLAGYCPGPAMTSLGNLGANAWLFTAAMVAGFGLKRGYDYLVVRKSAAQEPAWQR